MANQRKKGTKLVGAYVEGLEAESFKRRAKRRGKTAADLLRDLIKEYIRNNPEPSDKKDR